MSSCMGTKKKLRMSCADWVCLIYEDEEGKTDTEDSRCEQLWRAFRDEAGPWMTHRFTLHEWSASPEEKAKETEKQAPAQVDESDGFDGHLTKEIIASGLSMLDRCPVFYHFTYIKCVLSKQKLIDIEALASYHYLQYVDVSGNKLTTLQALGNLPFLKYLDASHNLLTTILDFKAPYFLTNVNLSYNKIKDMRDLRDFWSITDLNLSHNTIRVIEGLMELRYLTTLNLSFNRIETIENLSDLRIQFLHLQNNQIKSFEDDEDAMLYTLNNIRTINLSRNQVSSLKMFESVENLECLEIPYNHIYQLLDIYYLRNLKYLNKLNLNGNGVTSLRRYVEVCVTNIRNLIYLDGERINSEFWQQKISNRGTDVTQIAAHQRLKLLILEQLNKPQMWDWLLPYDSAPLSIIVLVGLQASRRTQISKKFSNENSNVVVGIPHTTRPQQEDEVEGDFFYYVTEEKFRKMLKKGKFLTYQEHLGFYFGLAHSEFKKASGGILICSSDLKMALCLKSKFLNTKLILALPSTKAVHLENLKRLYAVRLEDSSTYKIFNTPQAVKFCQRAFHTIKKSVMEQEIQDIVEELVKSVSNLSGSDTKKEPDDGIMHLYTASSHRRSYTQKSHHINPSGPLDDNSGSLDDDSNSQKEEPKIVSFTGARKLKIDDHGHISSEFNEQFNGGATNSWLNEVSKDDDDLAKVRTTSSKPSDFFVCHKTYSDIICADERIRTIFHDELNKREELLDLHWSTPGLFRELLFTDNEEETFQKLRQLLKDLTKYHQSNVRPTLSFKTDESVNVLVDEKLKQCFTAIERELSITDKQAAEYILDEDSHICGNRTDCKNPACPPFDI